MEPKAEREFVGIWQKAAKKEAEWKIKGGEPEVRIYLMFRFLCPSAIAASRMKRRERERGRGKERTADRRGNGPQ